jgi:hypothetical protein
MSAPNPATPENPESGEATDVPTTPGADQSTDRDGDVAALKSEAARWRKALREAQAENERLKLAGASEAEQAVAKARAEGASEFQPKWRRAVVQNAALSVLAERGCPAAEPALRALDLDDVDVDETGRFDRDAIAGKVDDLMRRYPVFAAPGGAPPMPTLTGDSQHRVTNADQVRPAGKLSDKQTEELLRYGLGH